MVTPHLPWKYHANWSSRFLVMLLTKKQRNKERNRSKTIPRPPTGGGVTITFKLLSNTNIIMAAAGAGHCFDLNLFCRLISEVTWPIVTKLPRSMVTQIYEIWLEIRVAPSPWNMVAQNMKFWRNFWQLRNLNRICSEHSKIFSIGKRCQLMYWCMLLIYAK